MTTKHQLLGAKRGRGRGSFIDSVLAGTDAFYAEILQGLKAWSAAPPRLRPVTAEALDGEPTRPASLSSTDFSSQMDPPNQCLEKERFLARAIPS